MKITLNWLKDYVDVNESVEDLANRLTLLGLEVEGIKSVGFDFDGVVVAEVLTTDPHPNADRLTLCRVKAGDQEHQIVCGAKNFKAGDRVPLALPGCTLPTPAGAQPFTIKVGKIRGVESQGMMCSPRELCLSDDSEGLLILPPDAPVGQPFAEHLGAEQKDIVLDFEITPNRPDLNSVLGIAREVAAATGNTLRHPVTPPPDDVVNEVQNWVAVRIEDQDLCPRYSARLIRGVKVGPSPDWLRSRLEKVGIRSINNIVDATNYVMWELGQPLHAFDYHLLQGAPKIGQSSPPEVKPTIVVRRATEGESFTTLDDATRTLNDGMLLIADQSKAIALAGVMGGLNSEINNSTRDVLLESAYFKPQNVRETSKRLDLKTDASYRFERGADPEICARASLRAAEMIVELAGGTLVSGVVDAYPNPFLERKIELRYQRTNELLGISISPETQRDMLRRLELSLISHQDRTCTVCPPSFRVDLKEEIDLIEEIARLFGIDNIPATAPRGAVGSHPYDPVHDLLADARRILTGLSLAEAQGQTLIHNNLASWMTANPVALAHPLSADMDVLRPSLLPGLLDALRHNFNHRQYDVSLFEIGRVFNHGENEIQEGRRLAIVMTGHRHLSFWNDQESDLNVFDLKGLVEEFFEYFGLRGVRFQNRAATAFFVESAALLHGNKPLGELGQMQPEIGRACNIDRRVYMAELDLDLILQRRGAAKAFKPLPMFPSIRRDIAMFIAESTTHEEILQAVKQARCAHLENTELFDVFRGKNVPEGQKSVAYAFTFRDTEKTLTDADANKDFEKIVVSLRKSLAAVVRD